MEKLLKYKREILILIIGAILLATIRFFQEELFYDPFINFFKYDSAKKQLPEYNAMKLFFSLFFRYFLNSVITVGVLYGIFKDFALVKLSSGLLILFFLILIVLFFISLNYIDDNMILFYIRRFLIQPLFLLLFLPAFYFQKLTSSKE